MVVVCVEVRGWRVADDVPADVLACLPTPLAARRALDAFGRGEVRAVVRADVPTQLADALDALDRGLSLVSSELIALARAAPALTDRQEDVLGAVMAGQSNAEIAHAIGRRPVTIKREVAALFGLVGASRRWELIARGHELGYRGRPLRP